MIPDRASQSDYDKLQYTENDTKDMQRMGQAPQLRRRFRALASFSVICVLVSTWLTIFIANVQGLIDGGLAGIFWTFVWTAAGCGLINASLAEMASIAPTDGAMYHWVSEFAHPKYEHFLSYMTGWMGSLCWQAANASAVFLGGTFVEGIVVLNVPNYQTKGWKSTLFVFGAVFITGTLNVVFVKLLPLMQIGMIIVNICMFFTVTILLWVGAPHNSASDVFTKFSNGGGWSSTAVSVMVGQISAIFCFIGSDAAAHMAEETRNAGVVVPYTVLCCFLFNAVTGLIFVITMLFTITSIEEALSDRTGFPAIWILRQALPNSKAGVNAIYGILIVYLLAADSASTLSASRQIFAFARDNGLPFSSWISNVHPRLQIPLNAVLLTCAISSLLACINIGSNITFNAILSLLSVALMATYMVSISAVLYRKYASIKRTDLALPKARWLMPLRMGMVVNFLALLYSTFAFFWCFWPNSTSHALADVNWAPLIFGGVFIFAAILYFVQGRKVYVSPVNKVIRRGS